MANFCGNCGVKLDADMKICPNCGRMVGKARRAVPASAPAPARTPKRAAPVRNVKKKKTAAPKPHTKRPVPEYEEEEESDRSGRHAAFVLIRRFVVIAVVVAAIYFAAFAVQVVRVKHATYEFNLPESFFSAKNYGEAFENATEDGHWHYNIVTQRVRYTATHNGEPIEITFSALGSVTVKEVDYDGKERTDDEEISNALMGLFI